MSGWLSAYPPNQQIATQRRKEFGRHTAVRV